MKQNELKISGNAAALQTNAAAIAHLDDLIANFYEPVALDGSDIARSWVTSRSEIMLQFTASGSQKFAQLTKRIAGTDRTLGIFLNGKLLVEPTVAKEYAKTGITSGKVQIVGDFTPQQASELVKQLASLSSDAP